MGVMWGARALLSSPATAWRSLPCWATWQELYGIFFSTVPAVYTFSEPKYKISCVIHQWEKKGGSSFLWILVLENPPFLLLFQGGLGESLFPVDTLFTSTPS